MNTTTTSDTTQSTTSTFSPFARGAIVSGKRVEHWRADPERLEDPLRWRRPRMVFVNSMSDLFHADVPDKFIAQVFTVMALAPRHTFQVLTKRPGRMASMLRPRAGGPFDGLPVTYSDFSDLVARSALHHCKTTGLKPDWPEAPDGSGLPYLEWPLPNVWLGTSVETQKWADVRMPKLLETPAAVRFLSCEPLLGPIDLYGSAVAPLQRIVPSDADEGTGPIDWIIVGGESGPGARPMHPDWARSLRDQCVAAGVPFFFKQWGAWVPGGPGTGLWNLATGEQILDVPMRHVGKKAAGRELDGRTWEEFPDGQR